MAKSSRTRMSRAEQIERFLEAAQALDCDPSQELFGEIIRAIAVARPGPPSTAPAPEPTKRARARRTSVERAARGQGTKRTQRKAEDANGAGRTGATSRKGEGAAVESANTKAQRTKTRSRPRAATPPKKIRRQKA